MHVRVHCVSIHHNTLTNLKHHTQRIQILAPRNEYVVSFYEEETYSAAHDADTD
jgi:hypothetical protein